MTLEARSPLARYLIPYIDGEQEMRSIFVDTDAGVARIRDPFFGLFERRGTIRLIDTRTFPPGFYWITGEGVSLIATWDAALACGGKEYRPAGN